MAPLHSSSCRVPWLHLYAAAIIRAIVCVLFSCSPAAASTSCAETPDLTETTIPPWLDVYGGTPNITLTLQFSGQPPISQRLNNGRLLTIAQTASQPAVFLSGPSLDPLASYVLLVLDPDAYSPSTPILKNVVHWIISNIPGSISPSQDVTQVGKIVLRYLEPRAPTFFPPPYGIHRYYNLLFKQARRRENIQNITTPLPSNFNTRDFIHKYNLEYPVAGTVFRVDVDS